MEYDIKSFLNSITYENSHYSENKTVKYIDSEFFSISNIHRIFIDIYYEYKNEVSYQMFKKVFNSCNIKFKKPRTDTCETCDEIFCQITKAKREKNLNNLNELQNSLKENKFEANLFYELKRKVKDENKFNSKVNITYDYQKNLQIPKTNVSLEYYLRKLYLYNFGVHNLVSNHVSMFLYPENFGRKTPNEVISFITHYTFEILDINSKNLIIFSDNAFSQNKTRFLWGYYYYLTKIGELDEITIYYPIPGHSFMEIDSDFGRIGTQIRKREKIFMPSEYANVIEITNPKNSIQVIEVNQSFSMKNNNSNS
jgi:hypothetical protein